MSGVIRVKRNGSWAPARGLYVKQSGSWVPAERAFIKQDGTWQQIYPTDAGVLSADPSSLSFTAYEDYESTTQTLTFSNSGTADIIVNNLSVLQSDVFTIQFVSNFTTPFTILPGNEHEITLKMLANRRGSNPRTTVQLTDTALLNIGYNIGVLGNTSASIEIDGTVDPDYASTSIYPSSISYGTYETGPVPSATITITNDGNGADLTISSITSADGTLIASGWSSVIAQGQSTTVRITAPLGLAGGVHSDTIYINSNAGTDTVPVTFTVASSGTLEYTSPGTYSWVVPTYITSVTAEIQAGGGGGGGSTEVGNGGAGGGGGSGGYRTLAISTTPGETLTIVVGASGAGAPFVGRNPGASGSEGPGLSGGSSYITGLAGTHTATGGGGGLSGTSNSGGGGGSAGSPNGNYGFSGQSGTNDYSSTTGGAGGNSHYGTGGAPGAPGGNGFRGSGGGGASAPDRVSPYNWAGGNGGSGYVKISW